MSKKELKCCFIGHRTIKDKDAVRKLLRREIFTLLEKYKVRTFLFGSRSDFNDLCYAVVSGLQILFPDIKRILYACKHETACMESERENMSALAGQLSKKQIALKGYEEEYSPAAYLTAGRASYVERNRAMIGDSDICVFYARDDYIPCDGGNSGTIIAYEYAKKVSKARHGKPRIINLYSETDNE